MSVQEGFGKVAAACRALGLARSSYYRSGRSSLESRRIRKEVLELSGKHPRYGYRRITALMRREGFEINAKRVARIRREEGIKISKKQRRMRRLGISTAERQRAESPGQVWSWDFVTDQTENGSCFRILTLLDEYTRQCLAIHPASSIRAVDVITVVEAAIARYGAPEHLRSDNGPEFIATCMQDWLKAQEIKTLYITPGSPWENGHIESFHDKLRDECLNRELFGNLREVRVILESWRVEYNERRPHSALGYRTPNEYAGTQMNRFDGGCAPPNPAPLAAAGVRGELRINATRWQTNEKPFPNEKSPRNFPPPDEGRRIFLCSWCEIHSPQTQRAPKQPAKYRSASHPTVKRFQIGSLLTKLVNYRPLRRSAARPSYENATRRMPSRLPHRFRTDCQP